MIVYATGFDAITGSFDRIDIRGEGGVNLSEKWRAALETFLGIMVAGFPNMAMCIGPHTALGNIPRSAEYNVLWVTNLIRYMRQHDYTYDAPLQEAVEEWTNFVVKAGEGLLSNDS